MSKLDDIRQYFFVIRELVTREIKRKYARSYLGVLWSVLQPLLSMAILSMIFSTIFQRSIENFPIYYLTGNIFWSMFTGATSSAMIALVDNKSLLIKVKLPMMIFPMARVYTALVNLGYSLIAYACMLIFFKNGFYWTFIFLILIIGCELMFSIGLGNILAVAYVFFGDIKHLYSVLLTLWMYCSAIFYPVESLSVTMKQIVNANPMYGFIACARKCIMEGQPLTVSEMLKMVLWGGGIFLLGQLIFSANKSKIMQRL